jgi:hypothetical protein
MSLADRRDSTFWAMIFPVMEINLSFCSPSPSAGSLDLRSRICEQRSRKSDSISAAAFTEPPVDF